MTATESQKHVIKYLDELVNSPFSSIWVPLWAVGHIRLMAAAIGLSIMEGMADIDANKCLLMLA